MTEPARRRPPRPRRTLGLLRREVVREETPNPLAWLPLWELPGCPGDRSGAGALGWGNGAVSGTSITASAIFGHSE